MKLTYGVLNDKRGFTLIEMLMAITVLLIFAVSFIPLFVFIAEASQANKARLVATKLASSEIEYIRNLPYRDIGNVGGNPAGIVDREKEIEINGIRYSITTDIWWVDDPSDDVGGSDPIPYDYKRVKVAVTSPSVFSGTAVQSLSIDTLASLEGGEEAFPGGNIRANTIRGWTSDPVSNVRIDLTEGPGTPQTLWTNEFGQALFAILEEGAYTIETNPALQGMIARVEEQDHNVVDGITSEVVFELEYPCHLEIELIDAITNSRITSAGTFVLKDPLKGDMVYPFTEAQNGLLDESFLGPLWPIGEEGTPGDHYGIEVAAVGYLSYMLDQETWNGQFSSPGESKRLVLALQPANASVTVRSQGSGEAVAGAAVSIYGRRYTYSGGYWSEALVLLQESQTGVSGIASFFLEDNTTLPDNPQPGNTYTPYYCVKVSSQGYVTLGPQLDAFQVAYRQQMISGFPVDTYEVELQPDFRRIRVRTETTSGNPRNDVRVRVEGPGGYAVEKRTGTDTQGEAFFNDLAPGNYRVYRWRQSFSSGYWDYQRQVSVEHGEYSVIYRY